MINVYEGSKPFVFISYCRKDKAYVDPILEALSDGGLRLWYDHGVPGGADWAENIVAHLKTSACVLCFISPNYNASRSCLRELNMSSTHKIPTIPIFLNRFQISGILEWHLCLEQALFCDNFSSVYALADDLVRNSLVTACRMDSSDAEEEYIRTEAPAPAQQPVKPNVENLMKRAVIALENGDWDDAAAYGEQMLNVDPENPLAYLTLLLADLKVTYPKQLATAEGFSEDNKHYKKLLRFADEGTKEFLVQSVEKAKNARLLRARNETAEAHFKEYAIIENGVLKKYTGSEANICIPYSVTSIGDAAFYQCEALTSVIIPDSVTSIGVSAFSECKSLTSVSIPNSVTSIEAGAFSECRALTSVTIPGSVTSIGERAFSRCVRLTSVNILDGVTSIGDGAFSGCFNLASVTIPGSVSQIGANPFSYCSKRLEIAVSPDNPHFFVEDGHLIDRRKKTLITGCERAPIPTNGSVTRIGNQAFSCCFNLTSVTIPDGVTEIGEFAFSHCSKLTSVTIPKSVMGIGKYAFCGCEALFSVMIPWSVWGVCEHAFEECKALTAVRIQSSTTRIDKDAFKGCEKATIITAKDGMAWKWAEKNNIGVLEEGQDWQECLAAHYRKLRRCQHCGGKLNGFFSKTCADCGKPKDY